MTKKAIKPGDKVQLDPLKAPIPLLVEYNQEIGTVTQVAYRLDRPTLVVVEFESGNELLEAEMIRTPGE